MTTTMTTKSHDLETTSSCRVLKIALKKKLYNVDHDTRSEMTYHHNLTRGHVDAWNSQPDHLPRGHPAYRLILNKIDSI